MSMSDEERFSIRIFPPESGAGSPPLPEVPAQAEETSNQLNPTARRIARMTSPRLGGAGLSRKDTPACRVLLAVAAASALTAVPCGAQDPGAGSAIVVDSGMVPRPDSLRPDSAAVVPNDTLPEPRRPPVDSAIGAACRASGGSAPDLLLVTFRPTATAEDRAAVARQVGGTLVAPSEHTAPGSWYLRVPGSAGDRSVADRVIVLSPVLEVGATRCPS
jgi:hypothetical protein